MASLSKDFSGYGGNTKFCQYPRGNERRPNNHQFANLSDLTFTCCRFIEPTGHLITGGHDKMVR